MGVGQQHLSQGAGLLPPSIPVIARKGVLLSDHNQSTVRWESEYFLIFNHVVLWLEKALEGLLACRLK